MSLDHAAITTAVPAESESDTCARCRNPGRCCVGFALPIRGTWDEVAGKLLNIRTGLRADGTAITLAMGRNESDLTHVTDGLPFQPLWQTADPNNPGELMWRFWCPQLGRDGKCTIYETRPALCAAYKPKSDRLCAEYEAPLGYEPASVASSSSLPAVDPLDGER